MKLALLLAIFFIFPFSTFAADTISSFTSDITLNSDGTFAVVETIVYDFENVPGHGIVRYIEKQHPQKAASFWKEQYIDIQLQEVLIDGSWAPYDLTDTQDQLEIKIGDPNVTVTGRHTYKVSYKIYGGYSYFDDNTAEIFWNVTGNHWEVPIEYAVARIHAPDGMLLENKACYRGVAEATVVCGDISVLQDGATKFTASGLPAGSGLTIAQEINGKDIQTLVRERVKFVFLLIFLVISSALALIFFVYRYQTKYKTGDPIVAQYEPYPNILPMYSGVLIDGKLDPKDISAAIVYLAEKKYIKVKKIEKKYLLWFDVDDYAITLLRPFLEEIHQSQSVALSLIFEYNAQVGETVRLSELKTKLSKRVENNKKISGLKNSVIDDLSKLGFYQKLSFTEFFSVTRKKIKSSIWWTISFLVLYVISVTLLSEAVVAFVVVLLFISIGLIGQLILSLSKRLTTQGYKARNHLLGFKLFLSVTDKERFAFHNAPEKSPEQFMEYLPYAIAFGVEKKWAKVFEGISIPDPDWYDGGSAHNFSAINLTSSLGAFSSSFVASSSMGAGSRSSSSFGGSGGGGFSGGGGGGGGGGRW